MKQKKLASRNVTTGLMAIGILIMLVGGIFLSPPQSAYSAPTIICFIIGFAILFWGLIRATTREHEP